MIKYEEISELVNIELERHKYKWTLWNMDWDDVKQIIKIRIHNKLHLYDEKRGVPLQFIRTVISTTLKNILRDNYGKFARPCVRGGHGLPCAFNAGGDKCMYTKSGTQCRECPLYAQWERKKKDQHNINQTLNIDAHKNEVFSIQDTSLNFLEIKKLLDLKILPLLTKMEKKYYIMSFIDNKSDDEIILVMGKNVKNCPSKISLIKRKIINLSKQLLIEEGIING